LDQRASTQAGTWRLGAYHSLCFQPDALNDWRVGHGRPILTMEDPPCPPR
jgi:hypothetical protein